MTFKEYLKQLMDFAQTNPNCVDYKMMFYTDAFGFDNEEFVEPKIGILKTKAEHPEDFILLKDTDDTTSERIIILNDIISTNT